jgi:hypothetical protein
MSPGFVVDRGHHSSPSAQVWVEGEPRRSFWSGLHLKGRAKHAVRTFRCERCGYLESYAGAE